MFCFNSEFSKTYLKGFYSTLDVFEPDEFYKLSAGVWERPKPKLFNKYTEILSKEKLEGIILLLKLPEEIISYILEAAVLVKTIPEVESFFCSVCKKFYEAHTVSEAVFLQPDSLVGLMGGRASLFPVLVLLGGVPQLIEYYIHKGIGIEVLIDTLSDIRIWMNFCRIHFGEWGMVEFPWLIYHLQGRIFKLGRLQYMPRAFDAELHVFRHNETGRVIALSGEGVIYRGDGFVDGSNDIYDRSGSFIAEYIVTDEEISGHAVLPSGIAAREMVCLDAHEWTEVLKKGDPVLDVHIQEGSKLDHSLCGKSLSMAIDFFDRHYPELEFKAFTCFSWLLDPQLQQLLKKEANIVRFQKEFYLYPVFSDETQALERVFKHQGINVDAASAGTVLQKKIIEFMSTGKKLQEGGMFLLKEDLSWGSQLYHQQMEEGCYDRLRLSGAQMLTAYGFEEHAYE